MNKEEFNIFSERSKIFDYAVKVSNQRSGSGVLFMPSSGEYAYIFTAAHVVKEYIIKGNLPEFSTNYGKVKYTEKDFESCLIYKKDEEGKYDENVLDDDESLGTNEDVAVFKILKKCFPKEAINCTEISYINENNLKDRCGFGGYGFPNNSNSKIEIYGTIDEWQENNKVFICENEYTISKSEFSSFMKGYSGTGLFIERDNRLALAGLVISCKINEMHNRFNAIGMSEILNEMKKLSWSIPKNEDDFNIPDTFIAKECNCINIINKIYGSTIQSKIRDIFIKISNEKTPKQLAINDKFYDVPICKKHRQDCPYYWAGKLLLLLYFECRESVSGDSDISLWKENIKIAYICSEGSGNADIGTVARAIVRSKVLKEELYGNNLIVWQSMEIPPRRILKKKQMNRCIANLMEENPEEAYREGYYLMNGENNNRENCIVHINQFIDELANIDDDDIDIENLKGIFEEVMESGWK